MNDQEIDDLYRSLPPSGSESGLDSALLESIRKPILADVKPVRPLPGTIVLAAAFCLLFAATAALCAYFLGFAGLHALSPLKRVAVCGFLLALAVASAFALAGRMRPGARGILPGWALPAIAFAAFEGLFFVLLPDYRLGHYLHSGLICLRAGLLCALPAALLAPLLLRRGYVVAPVSTGAAVGLGAGLVGLTVLEFHCPIETFPHVAVWHVAIMLISVAIGALSGILSRRLS
ncbi:MAG TPA: NrsF family protein [Bryobacteraceae bacterium]